MLLVLLVFKDALVGPLQLVVLRFEVAGVGTSLAEGRTRRVSATVQVVLAGERLLSLEEQVANIGNSQGTVDPRVSRLIAVALMRLLSLPSTVGS